MSQYDLEHAWNETLRLERMGIVQANPELAERMTALVGKPGRPRLYKTEAEKKKAYRMRLAKKVTDIETAQKLGSVTL